MGVVLAVAAAIGWGSSDYIAGQAARPTTALARLRSPRPTALAGGGSGFSFPAGPRAPPRAGLGPLLAPGVASVVRLGPLLLARPAAGLGAAAPAAIAAGALDIAGAAATL